MGINLNFLQERELHRLLEYERSTCSVNGESMYHCAFPYRPDDTLQAELIECGVLSVKEGTGRKKVVVITSAGYSYFAELQRAEVEQQRKQRREVRLIMLSVLLGAVCVIAGFVLARFLA